MSGPRHGATPPDLPWLAVEGAVVEPLAEILATVDLERALGDAGFTGSAADAILSRSSPDALLGGRVVLLPVRPAGPARRAGPAGLGDLAEPPDGRGSAQWALVEPTTEGRLTATLARHGEGHAGWYLRLPLGLDHAGRLATDAGLRLSRPADGPFGRERLILGDRIDGPHVLLVAAPAVPSRP